MTIDPVQYARRWKTLGVLSLSLVIIGLDNTILNVALPTLQHEFDASASKLQWMVDSYLLVFAGLLLVFGTLGDRFGRKLALQTGVSIFGLASLGALVADSADQVIVVRAAMGVGAALIMPATLSIIANLFSGEERAKAIAIWAALAAVGIGLGPLTGGLLLEWFAWPSVFMVNVPFAAAALLLGIRYVPESRDPSPGSFDLLGAALSIAGFSLLVYAIIEAPERGWTSVASSARSWPRRAARRVPLVGAPHGGADARPRLLPARGLQRRDGGGQRRVLRPARRHLRSDPVPAARTRLQRDRGGRRHEPDGARADDGRRLVEQGGPARNRPRRRSGPHRARDPFALTSVFAPDTGTLALAGWFFGLALSMGWVMAPATDAVVGAVPAAKSGVASATNTVARMVSGALGVAVLGSLVGSLYSNDVEGSLDGLPAQAQARAEESIGAAGAVAAQLPARAASDLIAVTGDAFSQAMGTGLLVAAALAAATAVVVARLMPSTEAVATTTIGRPDTPIEEATSTDCHCGRARSARTRRSPLRRVIRESPMPLAPLRRHREHLRSRVTLAR